MSALRWQRNKHRAPMNASVLPAHQTPLQVKGQSAELTSGFGELQAAQAAVEQQQAALAQQTAALEDRKAAKAERAEAEAAAQAAAEARLAAAAEQRKAGQERLASLRAAEEAREMQLRLAAQARAAVAAEVPGAAQLWRQLAAAVGVAPDALAAEAAAHAAPAVHQMAAASAPLSPPASPTKPLSLAPVLAHAAAPQPASAAVADDSSRYRAILADLEGSIDRWRAQLRAGEPLTFGSGHLGCASFFMPPSVAQPAAAAPGAGSLQALVGDSKAGRADKGRPVEQAAEDAAEVPEAEEVEGSSPSSTRAVQTSVSFIDVPRAVRDSCAYGCASSVPCSPAKGRRGLAHATPAARPASAGPAVASKACGGSGSPRIPAVGQVRAVSSSGLTLEAEYSMPGSPRHSKPRKWLKWKGSDTEPAGEGQEAGKHSAAQHSTQRSGDMDGCGGKGSWSRGIFAFRRSVDGSKQ